MRDLTTTLILCAAVACNRSKSSSAEARPDPVVAKDSAGDDPESTLARLLKEYPKSQFSEDPKLPRPDDPWNGKQVRLAGRVRHASGTTYSVIAPSVPTDSSVHCTTAAGAPAIGVGSRVVMEGTLSFVTRPRTFKGNPHNPLAFDASFWWAELHLADCRVLESTPRSFGVSKKAVGKIVSLYDLTLPGPHTIGERVAFDAWVEEVSPGRLFLQSTNSAADCLGPESRLREVSYHETLAFTARRAGEDAGRTVFDDCQPLDE